MFIKYAKGHVQECKSARAQECKSARVQECKGTKVQECSIMWALGVMRVHDVQFELRKFNSFVFPIFFSLGIV